MRLPRLWIYPALFVAIGIGAIIWGFSQAADSDAYRKAPYCGKVVTPNCYELFFGCHHFCPGQPDAEWRAG